MRSNLLKESAAFTQNNVQSGQTSMQNREMDLNPIPKEKPELNPIPKEKPELRSIPKVDPELNFFPKQKDEKQTPSGDWYVNNNTGEYEWFDVKQKREGYTGVGSYKVIWNSETNTITAYKGKNSTFIETIDMSKNEQDKYKSDKAAKFALIASEVGGSYVNNDDPTLQPLIIGASIENRMKLYDKGVKSMSSDGTIQGIKGFQAMAKKSYTDFAYGNKKRFGDGTSAYQKRMMHIGLSTVYTATIGSVDTLTKFYSVPKGQTKQFNQILYYAHGSGNTVNGDFDIAIPEGTNSKFQYVRGASKYKNLLNEE